MSRRLKLARGLLSPNGAFIITIDEHEVHHLRCLLEDVFPETYVQMVTIVINPGGVTQGRFSRVEEHAVFCFFGDAKVSNGGDDLLTSSDPTHLNTEGLEPQWESLLRRGTGSKREDRKTMFYPVVIDPERGAVVDVGEPLPFDQKPNLNLKIKGLPVAWPIRTDLSLGRWKVGAPTLKSLIAQGFVRVGRFDKERRTWGITYVTRKLL